MIFRKHQPAYPLSLYIDHIIYAKGEQQLPYLMELPDGRVNFVIELQNDSINTVYTENNLNGKHIMKHGWLTGVSGQAIVYESNNNSAIVSIRFTMGGFYALTKIPVTEIIHPGLEAELIFGNSFSHLYQKLINEPDIDRIFAHIEHHFSSAIADDCFESSVVKYIDQHIDKPIDWLVHKSGYSQKHLIHTLKKQTGFSPKYLQRLSRFQKTLAAIQAHEGKLNWSAIALANDYFDQAHFIKEFIHNQVLSGMMLMPDQD
jgi:AraC-like DNA-binding protein